MPDTEKSFQCSDCLLVGAATRDKQDLYRLAQMVVNILTCPTPNGTTTQEEKTALALAERVLAEAAAPYKVTK